MNKIRVLIVDDTAVFRRMVAHALADDPAIEVIGTAANGRVALTQLSQTKPDVVILDVQMPEMDGLETLSAIRSTHPWLPVIMFSSYTRRGARATVDALKLGASAYVTKPESVSSAEQAIQRIREEMIPKIKRLGPRIGAGATARGPGAPWNGGWPPDGRSDGARRPVEIVAIGVSTGGPSALTTLLSAIPADFAVPIVIVQHTAPAFTKLLASRLASKTALGVSEAVSGAVLRPAYIWIAPGDQHMELERKAEGVRIRLHQGPPENSCRPSVDVLFRSVAETYGPAALAIVLTGMGQDGLRGCERVRAAGGQILVQDEASSVVWGMPGFVARAGLADQILPLDQMGREITRRIHQEHVAAPV